MNSRDEMPEEELESDESLSERVSWFVTILFSGLNIIGILAWAYALLSITAYLGFPRKAEDAPLFIPLIYFALSLYSCFGKGRQWRIVRYVLNIPLLIIMVFIIAKRF